MEDSGEVGGERAEGGVEAEDDHGLQVVLVVAERRKCLLEVELPISFLASAFESALADDLVLTGCQEVAFGWRGREVEVSDDRKENCWGALYVKKLLSDRILPNAGASGTLTNKEEELPVVDGRLGMDKAVCES